MPSESPSFRFSGHETFPCRYTWLPKAVRNVREDPGILNREGEAMVRLGVGKNMVRSIRFWATAAGVIQTGSKTGHEVTAFGSELLLGVDGRSALDPFLEDIQTLWLFHWTLSAPTREPLFVWDFLLNRWQYPTLSASAVIQALIAAADSTAKPPSEKTLEQMFEVFVHTYLPTRGRKGEVREDNLDCPLVELELLVPEGVRQSARAHGRHEPVYKFRREAKPEISPGLFAYCLDQFWRQRFPNEKTLSFPLLASAHGSPGQIFKLPEEDLRARAEQIEADTDGFFEFQESAAQPAIGRKKPAAECFPLSAIYAAAHVA